MTSSIAEVIRQEYQTYGPLHIDRFMQLALSHPQLGYYAQKDRLGRDGDFITAPEISQMFGELSAGLLSYIWQLTARPDKHSCFLYEAGAGRGTLLADMRRAYCKMAPALADAPIFISETSPHFKAVISENNPDANINISDQDLIAGCATLPPKPLFGMVNELFDALGVRQACFYKGRWVWRKIGEASSPSDPIPEFQFMLSETLSSQECAELRLPDTANEMDIIETSPVSEHYIRALSQHIARYGGALLVADYGKTDNRGDTLQAVKNHSSHQIFDDIGNADITHLVDFSALGKAAKTAGARLVGPVCQGDFLRELGIFERAEALRNPHSPESDRALIAALDRLTSPAQMGHIFKIALLVPDGEGLPPGFSTAA